MRLAYIVVQVFNYTSVVGQSELYETYEEASDAVVEQLMDPRIAAMFQFEIREIILNDDPKFFQEMAEKQIEAVRKEEVEKEAVKAPKPAKKATPKQPAKKKPAAKKPAAKKEVKDVVKESK